MLPTQIIQQQQTKHQRHLIAKTLETTSLTKVAHDMADGESIRGLPTLNQPIIDQAKILTDVEIQQLNQKILSLYQQGKAQIGVIIVPTTGQESILISLCAWVKNGSLVQ